MLPIQITSSLFEAIDVILSPDVLAVIAIGLVVGIIFGALPGIGATVGMAIALPLTIFMDGITALILLASIYSGGMYGGSISAIIFNVPGTPAAAATTFDGYPMTRAGESITALTISAVSSAIGGTITILLLIILTPLLIDILLLFGSIEYFLMAVLGIAMITAVTTGSTVKGIVSGALGLLTATVGVAPTTPEVRYTFGLFELYDGLSFVAIMIGLFAITEMIRLTPQEGGITDQNSEFAGSISKGIRESIGHPVLMLKSSVIGMAVGALPGAGAVVSNFFAYAEAVRSSDDNSLFGKGDPRGVLASEASNNATISGSLIPTLAFGVPGGSAVAVLLGGLIMHGLQPGPDLFTSELYITYSILLGLIVGNILILILGLTLVTKMGHIAKINTHYIVPSIIVLSVVGSYALRSNWYDVYTAVVIGFIGFLMVKHNYSIIAFILGAVLGVIAEQNFYRSMTLSDGSYAVFVSRIPSIIIVALIVLVLIGPYISPALDRVRS